jgi:hypothetical protein
VAVVSELLWSLLCTFVDIYAGSTISLQEISWSTAALKTSDGVCAIVITGLIVTLVDIRALNTDILLMSAAVNSTSRKTIAFQEVRIG